MPRPDLPFEPLDAPRVAPQTPRPPAPINWFEVLAPQFTPPASEETTTTEADSSGTRKAAFGTIEEIVAAERRRQQIGIPEPAEITLLRHEARQEAQQLIGQALEQAQHITQEAQKQGYQDGFAQGYAAGEQAARQELTMRADAERVAYQQDIAAFIGHVEAERQRAWNDLEPEIMQMVFELAKQVIKQEVTASREVALSVVRNALRRVSAGGALRIRVHPDDLETVRANREDLLNLVDGIRHVEIIEDRRVGAGGTIVETDAGNIDARIETQVQEVGSALEQMVAQSPT